METKNAEARKDILLNKIKNPESSFRGKINGNSSNDPLSQKAKQQKLYKPVKIESDTVKMFKQIVYENDLESHGIIMNIVLRNWANEILENK